MRRRAAAGGYGRLWPRKLRPPHGIRAPQGAQVKPVATAQKRHGSTKMTMMLRGPPGNRRADNQRRIRGDALKRPTPEEQGSWGDESPCDAPG